MTTQPLKIESISPIITYAPGVSSDGKTGWATVAGNMQNADPRTGQTYHFTSATSASFSFSFFGDAVQLYGQVQSSLPSTCSYNASVEGANWAGQDPQANLLANFTGLPLSNHDVNVNVACEQGANANLFRFDYAIVNALVGADPGGVPTNQTLDDMDPRIHYNGAWSPGTELSAPGYYNDSQHYTQTPNDSLTLSFSGGAVAVYGSVQANHGQYTATLDGHSTTFNGSAPFLAVPVLLFFQGGLNPNKTYILTVTNNGPKKLYLDIDSFAIFNSKPASPVTHHNSFPIAAVAAVVASAIVALFLFLLYMCIRRRNQRRPVELKTGPGSLDLRSAYSPLHPPTILPSDLQPAPFEWDGPLSRAYLPNYPSPDNTIHSPSPIYPASPERLSPTIPPVAMSQVRPEKGGLVRPVMTRASYSTGTASSPSTTSDPRYSQQSFNEAQRLLPRSPQDNISFASLQDTNPDHVDRLARDIAHLLRSGGAGTILLEHPAQRSTGELGAPETNEPSIQGSGGSEASSSGRINRQGGVASPPPPSYGE